MLAALLAATPAAGATFTLTDHGERPDVAVDAGGAGHIVWTERGEANDVTQYCRIPRGDTTCAVTHALVPGAISYNREVAVPRVLVDGTRVIVLTTRGSYSTVYRFLSTNGGTDFDGGVALGDDNYDPLRMALLGPGDTISRVSHGGVFRRSPVDGGASGPIDLFPTQGYATLGALDPSTLIAAASDDDGQIVVSRSNGEDVTSAANWSAPAAIGPGTEPELVSGPSGVWLFSQCCPSNPVEVRHWTGSAFGAPASVAGSQPVGSTQAFAEDAAGGLLAISRSTGEGGLEGGVVYTRSPDGATWTPLEQLADRSVSAYHLRVAAAGAKDGFAVWDSNSSTGAVLGAPLSSATSTPPPDKVATCPTVAFRPVEALSLDGCWASEGNGFVAPGRVRVNGLDFEPKAGALIVVDPSSRRITTRGGAGALVRAGAIPIALGPVSWTVADASRTHVADVDTGSLGGDLFGFALRGTASVDFQPGESTIALHVALPRLFADVTGDATIRTDNVSGLRLDGIEVRVANTLIGPLQIKELSLKHVVAGNVWQGSGDLVLPPRPPGARLVAGFGLKGGAFDYARGAFTFPAPGILMAPAVFLTEIHFELTTGPTRILGGIKMTGGPQILGAGAIGLDGDLSYTFADPPAPAILKANGKGSVVGIPVADASVEYRSSGLFRFGGNLGYTFADIFTVNARIDGFLDTTAGTFMVEGGGRMTCPIGLLCPLEGVAILSSNGFAVCGDVRLASVPVQLGFGYLWGRRFELFLLGGCDLDEYRVTATAAQADGARSVRLVSGRYAMIGVAGSGGAPTVLLKRGSATVATKALVDWEHGVTYLFVPRPRAGSYRLVSAPGSPAITKVAVAGALPPVSVRGRVTGRGRTRVLAYRVGAVRRQRVTFTEESAGVARRLGFARRARGKLRFTPGAGPAGKRTIYALVEQNGRPRAKVRVARYVAPKPQLPAPPRGARAARTGRTITVTWKRVPGVKLYRVETKLTDGRHTVELLTERRLVLTDVAPAAKGTVRIEGAKPDLSTGRAAKVTVRELGAKEPKKKKKKRPR